MNQNACLLNKSPTMMCLAERKKKKLNIYFCFIYISKIKMFSVALSCVQGVEIESVSDDNFFEWLARIQGLRDTIWEGRLRVYVHLLQYGRAGYVCMSIYYNMGGQVTCVCSFITIWEGRLCVYVHLLQYGRAGYV